MTELYIGLMSGTSLDGVDGVLAEFELGHAGGATAVRVLAHTWQRFETDMQAELLALNTPGDNELHRAALAANKLVELYGQVTHTLLTQARLDAGDVRAIGAHGQTVRHRPGEFDGTGYTCQLNNPALLAERCGIDVIADLRSRDVAAGGQGAPLVPAFHQAVFGRPDRTVAALNVGGISNITIVPPRRAGSEVNDDSAWGFDCGPGNVLMDQWSAEHLGQPYDQDGTWAASGQVDAGLLQALLSEPYLRQAPPKSTGRDLFHAAWLQARLDCWQVIAAADVQATLCEFTALVCAQALQDHAPSATELIVCGGGALNAHLMARLQHALPQLSVVSSGDRGLPAMQVEAAAFAWLARAFVHRQPANLPRATGARGLRVLGALYPA
jgi:anhydro-N-acetylmuramic acid kinase